MSNLVRILLAIACIAALYYLVVALARSVSAKDLGRLELAPDAHVASRGMAGHEAQWCA